MVGKHIAGFANAVPFWASALLVPVAVFGVVHGGLALLLVPACTWYLFALLDEVTGPDKAGISPDTPEVRLFWYRLITLAWAPIQAGLLFWMIAYVGGATHLSVFEKILAFFGVGVITGTVGITYAHELMHRQSRLERWLADILLAMVFYSHFRSEHLLVHHRYVGTPRDAVTARFNEGFFRFFLRVVPETLDSAWAAERALLARKGLPWWDRSNPFWRYWGLQAAVALVALVLGGFAGLWLLLFQAAVAIWQLELVNYVEHYGLTRRHLGEGRYETIAPRHSWNAEQRASNWLLINLQRHSDHHYKPGRPFPLLQTYTPEEAPLLPFGYPIMTTLAMVPPLWRKVMNPRVRKWRAMYYPEITDWRPYDRMELPQPR